MGIYVTDGILLGIIKKPEDIPDKFHEDDILNYLDNIIKLSQESNAEAICLANDEENGDYYIGIFWKWSERRAMGLDDKWLPLYVLSSESKSMLQQEKYISLRQKLLENLKSYIPNLVLEDIHFYECRYFS